MPRPTCPDQPRRARGRSGDPAAGQRLRPGSALPSAPLRRGLTLIELLVVILVIAILASLLLVGIGRLRAGAQRSKTTAILGMVQTALGEAGSLRAALAPVEHPLAGSAAPTDFPAAGGAPRARFRRADGTALATAGEALKPADPALLVGADERVLRGDDRYAGYVEDGDLPLLHGLRRDRIGILGASADWISRWRHLPGLGQGFDDAAGKLRQPYDRSLYPDDRFLSTARLPRRTTLDAASTAAVRLALGAQVDALASQGALRASPAPAETEKDAMWIGGQRDVQKPMEGEWDDAHRVWLDPQPTRPDPGSLWPAGTLRVDGAWRRYRLRGSALYDAWGNEILYFLTADQAPIVASAGPDGVFRWHPGSDGVLQTEAHADVAAGDDRDGALDNVSVPAP